jgi:hypothetical protein
MVELIVRLVDEKDTPWQERHERVLDECSERNRAKLEEFADWFHVMEHKTKTKGSDK